MDGLVSVAETVTWKTGIVAPETVAVKTRLVGTTSVGEAVLEHEIEGGDQRVCATATTIRGLVDGGNAALIQTLS